MTKRKAPVARLRYDQDMIVSWYVLTQSLSSRHAQLTLFPTRADIYVWAFGGLITLHSANLVCDVDGNAFCASTVGRKLWISISRSLGGGITADIFIYKAGTVHRQSWKLVKIIMTIRMAQRPIALELSNSKKIYVIDTPTTALYYSLPRLKMAAMGVHQHVKSSCKNHAIH